MKQLLAAIAVTVSLLIAGGCGQTAQPVAQPAITQPTSAPVYTAWPFDANEAARRQHATAKALGIWKEADEQAVGKLIAQLSDDRFSVRDDATKKLIEFGECVQPLLKRKLQEGKLDPETADRIKAVLEKTAPSLDLSCGNHVTMKLVLIPAGKFMMGSPESEKDRGSDEGPQHEVTISKPFYMGFHKVTQEQYEQVMDENASRIKGMSNPVESVSWHDAVEFCRKLSTKTGMAVALPTEAQWEYSNRAGTKTRFTFGDDANQLGDYAWFEDNSDGTTHAFAQKKPNAWGLYDIHGNVWEWCSDWYDEKYYANAKNVDPAGPATGTFRVLRGGSWNHSPENCRSAFRNWYAPGFPDGTFGFRVVMTAD